MQNCSTCKLLKNSKDFVPSARGLNKKCRPCKNCVNLRHKERMKTDISYKRKHLFRCKNNGLLRKYGVSLREKREKWHQQQKRCAACKNFLKTLFDAKLDHNHKTGFIRDLLCNDCNIALGVLENENLVTCLQLYLKKWLNK